MRVDYWIVSVTAAIDAGLWCFILRGIVGFRFEPRTRQFLILREVVKMETAQRNRKILDALPLHERWAKTSRERDKKGK